MQMMNNLNPIISQINFEVEKHQEIDKTKQSVNKGIS